MKKLTKKQLAEQFAKELQLAYEQALWSGKVVFQGVAYTDYTIRDLARKKGVELKYTCPA